MDGMILLGGYDSADSDASDREEDDAQPSVVRVKTATADETTQQETSKPKLPKPADVLSQRITAPSFVNRNYAAPLSDLPTSRAHKRPPPLPDAAPPEAVIGAEPVKKLPSEIARDLEEETRRREEALRLLYEEEGKKKAKTDGKKETFHQKEKRKRDLGQASRAKNYVEEEKRILRQATDGFGLG